MTQLARMLRRAALLGFVPPTAVLAGVSIAEPTSWSGPLTLGAALWVTLAMAFAAFSIARAEHRRGAAKW